VSAHARAKIPVVPELPRLALIALLCSALTGRTGSAMGIRKDTTLLARS
jgi:hypothetical protein